MTDKLTIGRIQELTSENSKLREANRRLQVTGPALDRDKLIGQLRAKLAEAEKKLEAWASWVERADAAEADAGRLRGALQMVEWVERVCPWCLWCDEGHKPDCARQLALGCCKSVADKNREANEASPVIPLIAKRN